MNDKRRPRRLSGFPECFESAIAPVLFQQHEQRFKDMDSRLWPVSDVNKQFNRRARALRPGETRLPDPICKGGDSLKCEICNSGDFVKLRPGNLFLCESCFSQKMIIPAIPMANKLNLKGANHGKMDEGKRTNREKFCQWERVF